MVNLNLQAIKKHKTMVKKKQNFLEYMLNNPITGKNHMPGLTHDEILYGYTYNKKGEKVWPRKKSKK